MISSKLQDPQVIQAKCSITQVLIQNRQDVRQKLLAAILRAPYQTSNNGLSCGVGRLPIVSPYSLIHGCLVEGYHSSFAAVRSQIPYNCILRFTYFRPFNVIIFYSSSIYLEVKLSVLTSMFVSLGVGLVNSM